MASGRLCALVAILLLVCLSGRVEAGQAGATRTVLLSIANLGIAANEYVLSFTIDSWDVRPLAVCHIPEGWTLGAGRSIDPSGGLSGMAGGVAAALSQDRQAELSALFLISVPVEIRLEEKVEGAVTLPITFRGTIEVGRYGEELEPVSRVLSAKSYVLRPATQCPPLGR